jgi:CheY-like chemotaxis protein
MSRPSPATFTILVIDDDPAFLELASELLSGNGHRVLVASSGEDALVMVRAIRPDLILLDYFMPKVNGLAVVERLKADTATRGIPVVAITSGTEADATKLSQAGSVASILKPFEPSEFLRVIADILNATVGKGLSSSPRDSMVELILTEAQFACLRAAVTVGSEESAALGRGVRFGSKLFSPEPFAVKCARVIAMRLLSVAERSCPDVVPAIRTAIEQATT